MFNYRNDLFKIDFDLSIQQSIKNIINKFIVLMIKLILVLSFDFVFFINNLIYFLDYVVIKFDSS